jgi:hypothetical protein
LTPGGATSLAWISNKFQEEKQTERRNSLADTFWWKTNDFKDAVDKFGKNEGSFGDAVRAYQNTATRSSKDAADLINKWIDKFNKGGLSDSDKLLLDDFKRDVTAASGNKETLKGVLESTKYEKIIWTLEAGNMGWLRSLGSSVWASIWSSGSNTWKFAWYVINGDKIETGNGNPFAGEGLLEANEKNTIQTEFKSLSSIQGMNVNEIKKKLWVIGFQQSQLDKITDPTKAKSIATELAKEAGVF